MTIRQLRAIAKRGTPVMASITILSGQLRVLQTAPAEGASLFRGEGQPAPEIVRTLYQAGASFDVASLPEFLLVYENIKRFRQGAPDFIWDKIIYANPIKPKETLQALDKYKPCSSTTIWTNCARSGATRRTRAWRCACGCPIPAPWWSFIQVRVRSGGAVDLVLAAFRLGLVVEGLSFHVGSQCTNLESSSGPEYGGRGHAPIPNARPPNQDSRYGRAFPQYEKHVRPSAAGPKDQRRDQPVLRARNRDSRGAGAPGGHSGDFGGAHHRQGLPRQRRTCYYIDDSVYHTYSGIVFDQLLVPREGVPQGRTGNLHGVRADLRRGRRHQNKRPNNCQSWKSTIWFTPRTFGAYSTLWRHGSTGLRRRRSCT